MKKFSILTVANTIYNVYICSVMCDKGIQILSLPYDLETMDVCMDESVEYGSEFKASETQVAAYHKSY